jgi:DNA-directed RNA polymerase specialized sigma24 family protein
MLTAVGMQGLAAFYREFYPRLYRFVFARTGGAHADVDDIVQETLLAATRRVRGRDERAIEQALARIDESYKRVLTLRYLEGRPVRAIAEMLGESEPAVESRLTRAREAFRSLMGGTDA